MPNLLLFMTPGIGLNMWKQRGLLQRELKPYIEYVRNGWDVKILTFDRGEIPVMPEGIQAIKLPHRQLLWFLPWTHRDLGNWADVLKTNQSHYAFLYTMAAKRWKKPILLRCGFVGGIHREIIYGYNTRTRFYQWLEAKAFQDADRCQVPTESLSRWVIERYGIPESKISVVPNSINTNIFKPIAGIGNKEKSVVSVGRLTFVKRFEMLIEACAKIPGCSLTIIGDGPERHKLNQTAKAHNVNLSLPGFVNNSSLPQAIQEHTVFVITSKWEGHPKALLEAMACGMPCVGVEAHGTQDVINNENNGLLVKASPESLAAGLSELFENPELCDRFSKEALKYIESRFTFTECFSREYKTVQKLLV